MRRSPLRSLMSAAVCAAFLTQSTGAADIAPMLARGMMLPPPGRMAPLPMPKPSQPSPPKEVKPAGEPWLASAKVVAAWVTERLGEVRLPEITLPAVSLTGITPAAEPEVEAYEAASFTAANEVASMAALPAPEPPADRMLIAMEGRRVLASGLSAQLASILQYRSELKPIRPRFTGEWVGRGAVRARVDYMSPLGITRGEEKGFRVMLADGFERLLPNRRPIPKALMQDRPLYFAGDSVDVEVTIQNTTGSTLTDLSVASVQEEFTPNGEAGTALGKGIVKSVASLAPGETATLRWRIQLGSVAREAVNFEQTHLKVLSKDPAGAEKVLLEEKQAGIVDPPSL